jgi:hypothetical protein
MCQHQTNKFSLYEFCIFNLYLPANRLNRILDSVSILRKLTKVFLSIVFIALFTSYLYPSTTSHIVINTLLVSVILRNIFILTFTVNICKIWLEIRKVRNPPPPSTSSLKLLFLHYFLRKLVKTLLVTYFWLESPKKVNFQILLILVKFVVSSICPRFCEILSKSPYLH